MSRLHRYTFFVQAALIMGCLFVFGCENDPKVVNQFLEKRSQVEEATDVQSLLSDNGNPKALLKAPYMLRYNVDTSFLEFPKTLHINFFDSTGKLESQLNALYGKYFETRGKAYLRDSVIAFNTKGDTLRCPDLWWDQNAKKFYTDKFVRIKTKDKNLTGSGLEADQDLVNYRIIHPTGIILVPDSMMAK